MSRKLNTLALAHNFMKNHIKEGDICVDATAGNGNDTLFLANLAGENVFAFDVQEIAVQNTKKLLEKEGKKATVLLESHENIDKYLSEESVSCVCFNLGYLPKGDHNITTKPESTITALKKAMKLLKPLGIISLCIYYGGDSGFEEKNAVLEFLKEIDFKNFTVMLTDFYNRKNNPPIFVQIIKDA